MVRSIEGLWTNVTDNLVDDLAAFFGKKKVLEVYAGRGFLARKLQDKGVNIVATSILSGHDGHMQHGMETYVEISSCIDAVIHHQDAEVILVCWPTTDNQLFQALRFIDEKTPIVFIGEITDYSKNFWGGCSCDEFFENVRKDEDMSLKIRYDNGGYGCDEIAVFFKKVSKASLE